MEGVQVLADGAFEEEGHLGDEGEAFSESVEAYFAGALSVNRDESFALHQPEEGLQKGGLASSSAPDHSYFGSSWNRKGEVLQNVWQVISISHRDILEFNSSRRRPGLRQSSVLRESLGFFLLDFGVSMHSFDAGEAACEVYYKTCNKRNIGKKIERRS